MVLIRKQLTVFSVKPFEFKAESLQFNHISIVWIKLSKHSEARLRLRLGSRLGWGAINNDGALTRDMHNWNYEMEMKKTNDILHWAYANLNSHYVGGSWY